MEFLVYLRCEYIPISTDILLDVIGHRQYIVTAARNGIMQTATMETNQVNTLVAFHFLINEACYNLQSVGTLFVDVVA